MTSPIKIFSSDDSKELASKTLVKAREDDRKKYIESRKLRLENLLAILEPKDEFEKNQLEKLKEETSWLKLERM